MRPKQIFNRGYPSRSPIPVRCHLSALYEDFACGTVVKEACCSLIETLGNDVLCDYTMWRFDILAFSEAFSMALEDVRDARIVLVAMYGATPIAQETWRALEQLIAQKERESAALVAILGGTGESQLNMPAYRHLEELADLADLSFFAQTFESLYLPYRQPNELDRTSAHDAVRNNFYPHRRSRGWGINE